MSKKLFFLLAASLLLPSALAAQTAWTAVAGTDGGAVAHLDLSTAAATALATLPFDNPEAMAPGPGSGLFLTSREPVPTLYRFDTESLELEEIGTLGFGFPTTQSGLAAGSDGHLYLVAEELNQGLYRIDPETAATTLIAETDEIILALAAAGDRLFAIILDSEYGLYEIDTTTAEATLVHAFPGEDFGLTMALGATADGTLYLNSDRSPPIAPPQITHELFTIDPETGAIEQIAQHVDDSLRLYRGLVVSASADVVAVPATDSVARTLFITFLLVAALAVLRHRL